MSSVTTITAVQKCFHRTLFGLRAAHLNQRVVVTGGKDDEINASDEVLCGILLTDCVMSCFWMGWLVGETEMRFCVEFFT